VLLLAVAIAGLGSVGTQILLVPRTGRTDTAQKRMDRAAERPA
jgi:hypothetical protein